MIKLSPFADGRIVGPACGTVDAWAPVELTAELSADDDRQRARRLRIVATRVIGVSTLETLGCKIDRAAQLTPFTRDEIATAVMRQLRVLTD